MMRERDNLVVNFVSLKQNVYFVLGTKNGCIYDLKNCKLYSLDNHTCELLLKISKEAHSLLEYNNEEREFINELINLDLVEIGEAYKSNKIDTLKEKNLKVEFVWIEITSRCNLKCKHCYNESNPYCDSEMTYDDFKFVVDYLHNKRVQKIQIIGGEPMIHNQIKEFLEYCIGKFEMVEIFTNGNFIDEEWAVFFKKNNIKVALSLYSYNREEHDKVTFHSGSWDRTVNSIELLKKNSVQYRIGNTLMKDVDLGIKNTDLFTLNPNKDVVRMSGRGNKNLLSRDLVLKKLITKDTFSNPISERKVKKYISGHNCFSTKLYIASDLTVYPCVMERRLSHGIISNNRFPSLNKEILHLTKDKIKGCKNCEFRYSCFDCRSDSFSDDPFSKPWYCTYSPETGEWENIDVFLERIGIK